MANFGTTTKKKKTTIETIPTTTKDVSYDPATAYKTNNTQRQQNVNQAYNNYANAFNNRTQISDYEASSDVEKLYNNIMNAPEFSYDFNADQTYKNLAQQYKAQGQMGMKDTMGQAAALNGGLGTSYSQMAGQQVYNRYMQELADYIPQLEQNAYARYQDKMARLADQYNMALDRDETAYGRFIDQLNREDTDVQALYNMYLQAQEQANADRDYDLTVGQFEEGKRQWQSEFDYQKQQDTIANDRAEKEFLAYLAQNGLITDADGNYVKNLQDPDYLLKVRDIALAEDQLALEKEAFDYEKGQDDIDNAYKQQSLMADLVANGYTIDENGNIVYDENSTVNQQKDRELLANLMAKGYTLDENGNVVENRDSTEMQAYLLQNGLKYDENGKLVAYDTSAYWGDDEFSRNIFAGIDESTGKYIFYKDGKKVLFDEGINPYTGTKNPDVENGTFSNGYQPDNIGGDKLKKKDGEQIKYNGAYQSIWLTSDGKEWYWDGERNQYLPLD